MGGRRGRDSGFGIRDSGFGIRDSGLEIRDSRFEIRDSGFGIGDWGLGMRMGAVRACGMLQPRWSAPLPCAQRAGGLGRGWLLPFAVAVSACRCGWLFRFFSLATRGPSPVRKGGGRSWEPAILAGRGRLVSVAGQPVPRSVSAPPASLRWRWAPRAGRGWKRRCRYGRRGSSVRNSPGCRPARAAPWKHLEAPGDPARRRC